MSPAISAYQAMLAQSYRREIAQQQYQYTLQQLQIQQAERDQRLAARRERAERARAELAANRARWRARLAAYSSGSETRVGRG
jgi:hypothetical protein